MKKKNVDMIKKTKEENVDPVMLKKESTKRLIFTGVIAIAAIIGLYFTYVTIMNPKSVFVKVVNKGYEKLDKQLDKYLDTKYEDKTILVSSDVNFKIDMDDSLADEASKKMMEEYSKLKIEEKIGIDTKNNEMLMGIKYLYDNDDMINIGAYLKDNKFYLELKNIYDKYIEYPMNGKINFKNANTSNLSKDEIKYFLKTTKDKILKNMSSKDFKQSTEKIKKDKKTIKVSKITYGLSEKSATNLILNFYEDIKNDSKYIKIIAKLNNEKETDIKKSIEEEIKELKKQVKNGKLDKEVKVRFGILLKGFTKKHVGYVFETYDKAKFVYYENGDNKEIRLSKADEDLIRVSKKDNKTVITFVSNERETELTIEKSIKGKKTTYAYELSASGMVIRGNFNVEKIKENKDGTGESKYSFDMSLMGLVTFKINGNIKVENVDKLNIPEIKNTIKSEDLSESDKAKISEKIMNNKTLQSFFGAFGSGEVEVIEY